MIIEHRVRRIGQEPPPEIVESTLEMDRRQKNHKIDFSPEGNMKMKTNMNYKTPKYENTKSTFDISLLFLFGYLC